MISKVGWFNIQVAACVFDSGRNTSTGCYQEVILLEVIDGISYYINLNKDPRFVAEFGVESKTASADHIKNVKVRIFFGHKGPTPEQPLWKLHDTMMIKLFKVLSEITGDPLDPPKSPNVI
jgi:hypothetical protein